MTSRGDACRCPRLALSSSKKSIAKTVGFPVCPVGNQQIEVLLAEGNLIYGLYAVATVSRPTVGSLRSKLEAAIKAAFNACSISDPHTTVDAPLCSTLRPAAAFRCTPQATAISSPALAPVCEAIDTDLWCRNRCVPQRPLLQRWHVHRILRAFRGFFHRAQLGRRRAREITLLSLHRPMRLSDTRRFPLLLHRASVLRNRIKRACVLVKRVNGKINLNMVFRLRWLCEGRACRVQPFMLSLSVFL